MEDCEIYSSIRKVFPLCSSAVSLAPISGLESFSLHADSKLSEWDCNAQPAGLLQ